ncbi:XTP/dITP diphosphatase [Niameybacter massiliensis]|uniref:dITP/XTP pyrophosphatase n=1 Tax=Holtiella tumoricola TaxID=3018743 RepID=A0AA42DJR5_9FIRM|nr:MULTISPECIES: XTP/dITP diphosphatase [Lachnospirales]MDA3730224.1 XTP/dITP diphosphatase [Holtiella tumoricola]
MKKIIFATQNQGKVKEIKKILEGLPVEVLTMGEAGIDIDIEENGTTFEENAVIKAEALTAYTDAIILADDSGLEIDCLNKEPGVYSARYLGKDTPYEVKNQIILDRIKDIQDEERTARFVCAIAAAGKNIPTMVTLATIEGHIGHEAKGKNGFGYDPIFFINDFKKSTAELSAEEKNKISHRAKALEAMKVKLMEYLGE